MNGLMNRPWRGALSVEVQQFLDASASSKIADQLRAHAPRLDRRLRALETERRAILGALSVRHGGGRQLVSTVLGRIRTLVRAENKIAYDCYWQDLGGEAGA